MKWFVYILSCSDDSYYVGQTNNVENRFSRHRCQTGALHTSTHPPRDVVHVETFSSLSAALGRERQLKGWSHAKKQALIEGDFEKLRALSRSHD